MSVLIEFRISNISEACSNSSDVGGKGAIFTWRWQGAGFSEGPNGADVAVKAWCERGLPELS